MQSLAKVVSLVALAATIVPCVLYFLGLVDHSTVTLAAFIGTATWFVATPIWMGRELPIDAAEVEI